jgi:hypothetical protein
MRKFYLAFSLGLAFFAVLNVAPYFLFATPDIRIVGFPRFFWRMTSGDSRFFWLGFSIDLFLALYASYGLARWYQRRGERDYVAGEKT